MGESGSDDLVRLERVLAVVLQCLRETFPRDFYRRCAFSARAIQQLLAREDIVSHAVGGRFTALAVGRFDARYALQGFQDGPERYPHLWVETDQRLIDLGPCLLPHGSPFALVPMPALAWNKAESLPAALSYEPLEVLSDDATFSLDEAVAEEGKRFVACCIEQACRLTEVRLVPRLLTGLEALRAAEAEGDRWAVAAVRLQHATIKAAE